MSTLTREKVLQIVKTAQEKGKRPDFSGTDLSGMDLSGAYLVEAYFIEANFNQANLNQANLSGANLSQANLRGANLRGANLGAAYLSKAKLGQANLSGAYLSEAHLRGADLNLATLSGAYLNQTHLSGADLAGADLSGAELSQANLIWANLSQANLSGVDLSQANLSEADLSQANLCGADLSQADLFRANLSEADLSQANLIWADLSQANFMGANLSQANLSRAKLVQTNFSRTVIGLTFLGDIDLSVVKGLDSVEHRGPSTMGTDTLARARSRIPESFLRGCGLSDVQIETAKLNNPDLTIEQITAITSRIQELLLEQTTFSCFISYASQDEAFVQQLHDDLQHRGIRCWFAPEAMKIGQAKIRSTIDHSIRRHDKLLLILSRHSINSDWVEKEVEAAFNEEDRRGERVLFPIQLDETMREIDQAWAADMRQTRPAGDFSQWQDHEAYQQSLARLLRDLAVREE
jgi:uncharacterized protein YjbI with pentapeptide repeats